MYVTYLSIPDSCKVITYSVSLTPYQQNTKQ